MSVSMWSYRPEVCDGGGCPGDCDLCDKPKVMEDELTNSTKRVKRRVKNELNTTTDYIKRSDAIRAMAQYMMNTALIDNPEASDCIEEWEGNIAAPVMSTVKAADVRENVKGEWLQENKDAPWECTCSNCGTLVLGKTDYCANCGADMRGEA